MGTIVLQTPIVGQPNSTEDAKIASDMNVLQTAINGQLDATNLSGSAGITFAQLAAGAGRMSIVGKSAAYTMNSGELVICQGGAGFTVTLPAATLNAMVGIVNLASGVITVASTGVMAGPGFSGLTSLTLGALGSCIVLQCDGTGWYAIAGGRDTGWLSISGATGVSVLANAYYPSARLQGDRVTLKGGLQNNTGGTLSAGASWGTLPAGCVPTVTYVGGVSVVTSYGGTNPLSFNTAGTITQAQAGVANGLGILLDGISFSIS